MTNIGFMLLAALGLIVSFVLLVKGADFFCRRLCVDR